jgi:hypothetical protein
MAIDAVQQKEAQGLEDLRQLVKAIYKTRYSPTKDTKIKFGQFSIELKNNTRDGKKGSVTGIFTTRVKSEKIMTATYGNGQAQYNNFVKASEAVLFKLEYRIRQEIAFFKRPTSSFDS